MNRTATAPSTKRIIAAATVATLATIGFAGCSSTASSSSSTSSAAAGGPIGVSLIVKTTTNPFFVAMEDGAKKAADKAGVTLTLAAGKADGDEASQITAVENAISKGDKGILITPTGPGVEDALVKARAAGLFVIALDTPPSNKDSVDITFATDNYLAGQDIGKWTAAKLAGKKATIAMLDLFGDKIVSVDVNRDQGFLDGMGINTADKTKNGDEAKSGTYSGGDYEIVGNEPTNGAEDGGRTAAETLLSKNPNINVVYTINEPAAYGAYQAFKAAGKTDMIVVSIDGGCAGVKQVKDGIIGATAQQYPVKMAELGVQAIVDLVTKGTKPAVTSGLDFYNTGVALVTDAAQTGVDSIDTTKASGICWG